METSILSTQNMCLCGKLGRTRAVLAVSQRNCVLCAQKGRLIKTSHLSTQNMRFDGKL